MTYQHKRDPCSKETKEILQNIFRHDLETYHLAERKSEATGAQQGSTRKENGMANVLPAEAAVLLSSRGEAANPGSSERLERYTPPREVDFEATEAKDSFEKKKKRRNYQEFRPDYAEGNEE